jgi:hypothetical protein
MNIIAHLRHFLRSLLETQSLESVDEGSLSRGKTRQKVCVEQVHTGEKHRSPKLQDTVMQLSKAHRADLRYHLCGYVDSISAICFEAKSLLQYESRII